MKKIAVASLITLCFYQHVSAENLIGTRTVLLDNDRVEVVRLVYPVNTESGMHSHQYANRTVYVLQGGVIQLIPADNTAEKIKTIEIKKDQVLYLPASTHNVKNIGDSEIVLIETEIK